MLIHVWQLINIIAKKYFSGFTALIELLIKICAPDNVSKKIFLPIFEILHALYCTKYGHGIKHLFASFT